MKKALLISLIVLAGAGYYAYQDPTLRAYLQRQSDQLLPAEATHHVIYRWKDSTGQWQVSNTPPDAGIDYETIRYHKDTNLIPAERLTGKKPD